VEIVFNFYVSLFYTFDFTVYLGAITTFGVTELSAVLLSCRKKNCVTPVVPLLSLILLPPVRRALAIRRREEYQL
jgi:hypothetical protein